MTNQDIENYAKNILERLLIYQGRAVFAGWRASGEQRPDLPKEKKSVPRFSPFRDRKSSWLSSS
jgi:hypothetical protein